MRKRFTPSARRETILKAAVLIAEKPGGWAKLTRQAIAEAANCSEGLVSRYLGNMAKARALIMKFAVRTENIEIIVQSLAAHDGYAVKKWLPVTLHRRAVQSLLEQ